MAAEYLANAVQAVNLNTPILFSASIPCTRGYIYHEDETGIFILRGITGNSCNNFAQYQVTFNGNIAIPTGGTVGPVALALSINGEPRVPSRSIFTPSAVEVYGNVTSTAIIKVPKGCCFTLSVDYVNASNIATTTPTPTIEVQNANLTIARIA